MRHLSPPGAGEIQCVAQVHISCKNVWHSFGTTRDSRGNFYFYDVDRAIGCVPIWFSLWLFGFHLLYWESGTMHFQ